MSQRIGILPLLFSRLLYRLTHTRKDCEEDLIRRVSSHFGRACYFSQGCGDIRDLRLAVLLPAQCGERLVPLHYQRAGRDFYAEEKRVGI